MFKIHTIIICFIQIDQKRYKIKPKKKNKSKKLCLFICCVLLITGPSHFVRVHFMLVVEVNRTLRAMWIPASQQIRCYQLRLVCIIHFSVLNYLFSSVVWAIFAVQFLVLYIFLYCIYVWINLFICLTFSIIMVEKCLEFYLFHIFSIFTCWNFVHFSLLRFALITFVVHYQNRTTFSMKQVFLVTIISKWMQKTISLKYRKYTHKKKYNISIEDIKTQISRTLAAFLNI